MGPLTKHSGAQAQQIQRNVIKSFFFLTIVYTICGIAAIGVGAFYTQAKGEPKRIFIVTASSLRVYIFVGVYMLLCGLMGILISLAPTRRTKLLKVFIFAVTLIIIITLCISLWLWTRTLNINGVYGKYWRNDWSDTIKDAFQKNGNCCGFLNRNDSPFMDSASCKDKSIQYGCMYTVIFYAQHHHRYIYAGLIVFMLIGLGSMVTGIILLIQCSDEERVKWSQKQYFAKKAMRYQDTQNDDDSAIYSMHELQTTNYRGQSRGN